MGRESLPAGSDLWRIADHDLVPNCCLASLRLAGDIPGRLTENPFGRNGGFIPPFREGLSPHFSSFFPPCLR